MTDTPNPDHVTVRRDDLVRVLRLADSHFGSETGAKSRLRAALDATPDPEPPTGTPGAAARAIASAWKDTGPEHAYEAATWDSIRFQRLIDHGFIVPGRLVVGADGPLYAPEAEIGREESEISSVVPPASRGDTPPRTPDAWLTTDADTGDTVPHPTETDARAWADRADPQTITPLYALKPGEQIIDTEALVMAVEQQAGELVAQGGLIVLTPLAIRRAVRAALKAQETTP